MSDLRLEVVKRFEQTLIDYEEQEISDITNSLLLILNEYEIQNRCTEIIPYNTTNESMLKQYAACLHIAGKSINTIKQYVRTCNNFFTFVGNKSYDEITTIDVRTYLAYEKQRGVSNRTLENTRSYITTFFSWLTEEEYIPKSPCTQIKPIKFSEDVKIPYSDIDIDNLRCACSTERDRAMIELLLSSGLRVSELRALNISDIDFKTQTVTVHHGKGDKSRVTGMSNLAAEHLNNYLQTRKDTNPILFINRFGDRLESNGIRFILNNIGSVAKVDNVHPHRFRRTFATGLANRGMDVQEIKLLLGHSDLNTTLTYVHTNKTKLLDSYKRYVVL